jgi:hypothetical protein
MATFVHIDIPTDNLERSKKFYSELFGWTFEKPFPDMEYYIFATKDLEGNEGIAGGMGNREEPGQSVTNFIEVPSLDEYIKKIKAVGGKASEPMPVPGMGYLSMCEDTEGNGFGIWEGNPDAK